jgi:cyclic AMP-responsive element-binding protein 3
MEMNLSLPQAPGEMTQLPVIKAEPPEMSQFLKVTPGKCVQETPSSHGQMASV